MKVPMRFKLMILSKLEAYHTKIYVYLCWTYGGDLSSRPVGGCPVTANMINDRTNNQISTHGFGITLNSDNLL